jgi:hypothetical protein
LQQLPSSTAAGESDPVRKLANDELKLNMARGASVYFDTFVASNDIIDDVIAFRDAIFNGGGGRGLMIIPVPPANDAFYNRKINPVMMVVAYVLTRYLDLPATNVAPAILRSIASLREITVAAGGVAGGVLAQNRGYGPYTDNNGDNIPAHLNDNLNSIATKFRIESLDSTGHGGPAAVGPLAAVVGRPQPQLQRDAQDPRIVADNARVEAPLRAAARAGTASLTWLGVEVPAADDTQSSTATQEFEAIHKVKLYNSTTKRRLEAIGLARFNTHFIRDLFFIANVVRLVRLKLNRELTHSRGVLRASHMAVAPDVTEYGMDPFGANSVFESNTRASYDKDSKAVIGNPRWDDGPDDGAYSRKTF